MSADTERRTLSQAADVVKRELMTDTGIWRGLPEGSAMVAAGRAVLALRDAGLLAADVSVSS